MWISWTYLSWTDFSAGIFVLYCDTHCTSFILYLPQADWSFLRKVMKLWYFDYFLDTLRFWLINFWNIQYASSMYLLMHSRRIAKYATDWCSEIHLHTLWLQRERNLMFLFKLILLLSKFIFCMALWHHSLSALLLIAQSIIQQCSCDREGFECEETTEMIFFSFPRLITF